MLILNLIDQLLLLLFQLFNAIFVDQENLLLTSVLCNLLVKIPQPENDS
jgi:hypothetical protein